MPRTSAGGDPNPQPSTSMRRISVLACSAAAIGSATLYGCGGDSTGPKTNNALSAAEAQTVAAAIFTEINRAIASATPTQNAAMPSLAPAAALVPSTFNATVNTNCQAGGTIKGTYSFTTDFNAQGSGTESGTVTVTANQCVVSTGTRSIATNGSYTFTFSGSFTNGQISSNFVWKASGNFTWTGGSCALDYSFTITPANKVTYSGSMCGVSINGSSG
jgi:hypothetical protein